MHELLKTNRELAALIAYLDQRSPRVKQMTFALRAVHSTEEDDRNTLMPRGFCHVREGEHEIYCAAVIEAIIPCVRVGLLLHEVAHLSARGGMKGGQAGEITTDKWILDNLPESGYNYLPIYEYHSEYLGRIVTARNIQTVSPEFVRGLRTR
jgi:hypothetical protein